MLTFASVAGVALVALLGAGAVLLSHQTATVQLSSVSATAVDAAITVTPPVVVSKCSTPTTFKFTGSVTDTQPGTISYQWVYSSGKPGPVQKLTFTGVGQQAVSPGIVSTSTAGNGWAELKLLLSPAAKTSSQASYQLLCSSANSDITVAAKIAPAALSFASCSAPHPTLTATGTITSKNAGTVSFYWAMSNGTRTTPVQLIFNHAGTQAANPLTFATWVPSSGDVVLVVTKPAVAASKPAVYSVTCTPPAAPSAPAVTAPTAVKTSAKASVSPTVAPTTAAPTTAAPTTAAPTTSAPVVPTTSAPVVPTTSAPAAPTTSAPAAPTTAAPGG